MGMYDFAPTQSGYNVIPNYTLPNGGVGASNLMGAGIQAQAQQATAPTTPGAPGVPDVNLGPTTPLGMNTGTMSLALGGLQTIGGLWAAFEQNKLAKKQFEFQKNVTNANMANQIQSYNTTLGDRIHARAYTEQGQAGGMTQAGAAQYMAQHSLQKPNLG